MTISAGTWGRPLNAGPAKPRSPRGVKVSWAEFEAEPAVRRARIYWAEASIPQPSGDVTVPVSGYTANASHASATLSVTGGPPPDTSVKAFPTAYGFGAISRGGRGPVGTTTDQRRIFVVGTLSDASVAGTATTYGAVNCSLRYALAQTQPRFITFRTGGNITTSGEGIPTVNPYYYVAGQTAPGGGICLRQSDTSDKNVVVVNSDHGIFRFIRVRRGSSVTCCPGSTFGGARGIITNASYQIYDHCDFAWGTDMNANTAAGCNYATFQWCLIYENINNSGEGAHALGLNFRSDAPTGREDLGQIDLNRIQHGMTCYKTVMIHHMYRVPQVAAVHDVEVINTIVYNQTESFGMNLNMDAHGAIVSGRVRFIHNFFKRISLTGTDGEHQLSPDYGNDSWIYIKGCIGPHRTTEGAAEVDGSGQLLMVNNDEKDLRRISGDRIYQNTQPNVFKRDPGGPQYPVPTPYDSATSNFTSLITNYATSPKAGAYLPQYDETQKRVLADAAAGGAATTGGTGNLLNVTQLNAPGASDTSKYDTRGFPLLAAGTAPTDTDNDGVPDSWWVTQGYSQASHPDPRSNAPNGYLWIENYLNELAGDVIP